MRREIQETTQEEHLFFITKQIKHLGCLPHQTRNRLHLQTASEATHQPESYRSLFLSCFHKSIVCQLCLLLRLEEEWGN